MDPAVDQADALLRILQGHFSLQPYIAKNWILHFQQFSKFASEDIDAPDDQLLSALWRLVHRHASLTAARNIYPPPLLIELSRTESLQRLQHFPNCYVQIRWSMGESYMPPNGIRGQPQQGSTRESESTTSLQPLCLLHEAIQVLTSHMQNLMRPDAFSKYSNISPQMLSDFRNRNAPRAFTCRFPNCSRRLDGYPDEAARDAHERTHTARYLCPEQFCTFNSAMGFGSAKALAAHRKRFHQETLPRIPMFRKFRKTAELDQQSVTKSPSRYSPATSPFGADQFGDMDFANLKSEDLLDNFDFDSFLNNTAEDNGLGFDADLAFPDGR